MQNRKVGKFMIFFNKIKDLQEYLNEDMRFVRKFIREQEMRFRFNKSQNNGKGRYDEVVTYYICPPEKQYLTIKRLEHVINQNSGMVKIKVEENGILVMRKE